MSTIHLVVGNLAAQPLQEAVAQEESMQGEVVVLKDILNVGPLKTEGLSFSEGRSEFWKQVTAQQDLVVDDLERLMQVSSQLSNNPEDRVWFWMAPLAADIGAYFWLLHFLKKHQGRFYVVNVNGLPFLDNNGKLFYPDSISFLPLKEIIKARKLARVITPSEWETDGDEWTNLVQANAGIRIFEGGKKLSGHPLDHYDTLLLSAMNNQNQKAGKLVNQVLSKNKISTGDLFLHWRLRVMAEAGLLEIEKNDLRLKGKTTPADTEQSAQSEQSEQSEQPA
jgi:hypothetical protein